MAAPKKYHTVEALREARNARQRRYKAKKLTTDPDFYKNQRIEIDAQVRGDIDRYIKRVVPNAVATATRLKADGTPYRKKLFNLTHDLTPEQARAQFDKQGGKCALLGVTMNLKRGSLFLMSPDRIKSEGPYTADNFQWLCIFANRGKNDHPNEMTQEFVQKLREALSSLQIS